MQFFIKNIEDIQDLRLLAILEIQGKIEKDQEHIQGVKPCNVVEFCVGVEEFVEDSEDIAQDNQHHKDRTLALHFMGTECLSNRDWPTYCKAEQEKNFEYFH